MPSTRVRRLLRAVGCATVLAPPAWAQTGGTIVVTVTDRTTQHALNGVQVQVAATRFSGLTDGRGQLTLAGVPAGTHAVRVLVVGYRSATQQITVMDGGIAEASFALNLSPVTLDEVVVTGTGGAVEKRKLGTTLGTVDVARVREIVPAQDFGSVLQARIPGVRSIGMGGGPGAAKDLRIRGASSFTLGERPVIYVDGVRVDNYTFDDTPVLAVNEGRGACCFFNGGSGADRLADLNPDDIERIEVVKGAAAATLYGTEASNGVIQVFTKRGRYNSAPRWTLSYTTGFNRLRNNLDSDLKPRFSGPAGFRAHDPAELIQNGQHQNADVTVQGGGREVSYFAGAGVLYDQGSIQPSDQLRGNARVNLRWQGSGKVSFDLNSAFTHNRLNLLQSGNNWTALLGNALIGNPLQATDRRPFGEPWVAVSDIRKIESRQSASRYTGGLTINYRPSESFGHRFSVGLDQVNERRERFYPFGSFYIYVNEDAERDLGFRDFQSWTLDYLATLAWRLSPSVESDFSFGAQGFWEIDRQNVGVGENYAGPGATTVSAGAITYASETFREEINVGLFGQSRFGIANRWFVTLGARLDGNSAFGENFGLQFYPKSELAYLLKEGAGTLSSLKLRAAVGRSGLAPGAFDQFRTFEPITVLGDVGGVRPSNPGNADLEPEKTTEFEGGFDAGFFNGRVSAEFTYYRAYTTDALLKVPFPPSEGFSNPQLQNAGSILNTGWELKLDGTVIEGERFRWAVGLNMDGNSNTITSLGLPLELGGKAECNAAGIETRGKRGRGSDGTRAECKLGTFRLNHAVNSFFTRTFVSYDRATNTHTRSDTAVFAGDPLPKWNASLSNSLEFGPFRLYGLVSWETGARFDNGDRPYRVRQSASNEFLQFLNDDGTRTFQSDSTLNYWTLFNAIDKRDHIRIREVSLSYQLPEGVRRRLRLGPTTVAATAQNLHWWDGCHCRDPNGSWYTSPSPDPATGGGGGTSDFLSTPQARAFRVTIRTTF
jgi:TonB-dependent starch-binding outer membrane protein SusC